MHQPETCVVTAWCFLNASLDWSALEQTAPTNGQLSSENVSPTRLKRKWKGILAHTFTGLCLIEATVSPSLWMEKRSNLMIQGTSSNCHESKESCRESLKSLAWIQECFVKASSDWSALTRGALPNCELSSAKYMLYPFQNAKWETGRNCRTYCHRFVPDWGHIFG